MYKWRLCCYFKPIHCCVLWTSKPIEKMNGDFCFHEIMTSAGTQRCWWINTRLLTNPLQTLKTFQFFNWKSDNFDMLFHPQTTCLTVMAPQFCVAVQSLTWGEYGVLRLGAVYQHLIYNAGQVLRSPRLYFQSQPCLSVSLLPLDSWCFCWNNCSNHREEVFAHCHHCICINAIHYRGIN